MKGYLQTIKELELYCNNSEKSFSIICISNIVLEPFLTPFLKKKFYQENINLDVTYVSLEEYRNVKYSKFNMVILWIDHKYKFLDNFDYIEIISFTNDIIHSIVKITESPLLWIGYNDFDCVYHYIYGYNYKLNSGITNVNYSVATQNDNIISINLNSIITQIGAKRAFDMKNDYKFCFPYTLEVVKSLSDEIFKQYKIIKGETKKCLVLDCDNVLWGGILSEDGVENIKLGDMGFGRIYLNFQRFVMSLYHHGVILAICSKNDLADVLFMFQKHSEMIIKEKHISCFQVNWKNKPDNIKEIAQKLNIGLDSIVFVDDSIVEIEAVKALLPEVTTILFEYDMDYEQFSCFNLNNDTNITQVEKRNETYRTNEFREELKLKYLNYADYIQALDVKIDIHEALPIEYNRISELTQRTNKCTNGKRYTVADIKRHASLNNTKIYTVSVSDRFSDLGLVGVIEVEDETLTLFSLSCRALGREVEDNLLGFVRERHRIKHIEYHFTGKNESIKAMLIKSFPQSTFEKCTKF